MRPLSKKEEAIAGLINFVDVDFATLQVTQTGLKKGYTDATVPFREFVKRTGIHDYSIQKPGVQAIKYISVFALTTRGPEVLEMSFQRPATKGGRMCRVSMLGGLKRPLNLQDKDTLIFFVRDNQLQIANLTNLTERTINPEMASPVKKHEKGTMVMTIAKNRVIHVMEAMPECEANTGSGARANEIAELTGMLLESSAGALVNLLLDELQLENRIQTIPTNNKKYRLCL
jgi:hypothetical protein